MVKYGLDTEKVYTNKAGFKFRVVEFVNCFKVKVVFDSGYFNYYRAVNIKHGRIKDPMATLIYGAGVNDAGYAVNPKINVYCPFYRTWKNMLKRCYCDKDQDRNPTYAECSVSDEWLIFSNFKKWMEKQDWEGKQLDKDILKFGNKTYSSDRCVFVSGAVNSVLVDRRAKRGKFKVGVSWYKRDSNFLATVSIFGRMVYLGRYDTENEAHQAYVTAKAAHIRGVADTQEKRVRDGLYRHAAALEKTCQV